MDPMIKELINYGVLGIGIVALARYIMYMHRSAKEERKEWQAIARDGQTILKDINEQNRETAGVISGLRTLLETTREKE